MTATAFQCGSSAAAIASASNYKEVIARLTINSVGREGKSVRRSRRDMLKILHFLRVYPRANTIAWLRDYCSRAARNAFRKFNSELSMRGWNAAFRGRIAVMNAPLDETFHACLGGCWFIDAEAAKVDRAFRGASETSRVAAGSPGSFAISRRDICIRA